MDYNAAEARKMREWEEKEREARRALEREKDRLRGLPLDQLFSSYEETIREAIVEQLADREGLKQKVASELLTKLKAIVLGSLGVREAFGRIELDTFNGVPAAAGEVSDAVGEILHDTIRARALEFFDGKDAEFLQAVDKHLKERMPRALEGLGHELAQEEVARIKSLLSPEPFKGARLR